MGSRARWDFETLEARLWRRVLEVRAEKAGFEGPKDRVRRPQIKSQPFLKGKTPRLTGRRVRRNVFRVSCRVTPKGYHIRPPEEMGRRPNRAWGFSPVQPGDVKNDTTYLRSCLVSQSGLHPVLFHPASPATLARWARFFGP